MNPASMFVGFISPKEFFSVINRKHVENHKLNLFDVNIDPLEFKLSFGSVNNGETEQDLDNYFAYCVAANLNGYLFYSPANLANGVSLLACLYFKDALEDMPEHFFVQAIFAVYLLSFSFTARIKVFPEENEQAQFNWFVELFFNFYKITFQQLDTKISKEDFEIVRKRLLNQTSFFFLLFHFYKRLNTLLKTELNDIDHLNWIFGELPKEKVIHTFKNNYQSSKHLPNFSPLEEAILAYIRPSDILIKYLFGPSDAFLAVDTIISKIFPLNEVDPLVQSFLKGDKQLGELFTYLLEIKKYKYGFFAGVQNYMIKLFRSQGKEEILEEIDEMLSAIDNGDDANPFDIPERIKRESKVTERLLNFYVILLGGFTNARGDNFFLRIQHSQLLQYFSGESLNAILAQPKAFDHLSIINFQYQKVRHYYEFINEQLRNGSRKIHVPVEALPENLNQNLGILRLYCQGMVAALFQDLNHKDLKLTIKNPTLLILFKEKFGKLISEWVKKEKSDFLKVFFAPITEIRDSTNQEVFALLDSQISYEDLGNLKDALYRIDFWMNYQLCSDLSSYPFAKYYGKALSMSILGNLRESLFGLLLLLHMLEQEENTDFMVDILLDLYIIEMLGISLKGYQVTITAIKKLRQEFSPFLNLRISLDDNEDFLKLICKGTISFLRKNKKKAKCFSGDDLIWFRGLLKNITYYNKRFVIPE